MTDNKPMTDAPHADALNDGDLEQVSGGNTASSSYYEGTVATGGIFTKPTAKKLAESGRETEGR